MTIQASAVVPTGASESGTALHRQFLPVLVLDVSSWSVWSPVPWLNQPESIAVYDWASVDIGANSGARPSKNYSYWTYYNLKSSSTQATTGNGLSTTVSAPSRVETISSSGVCSGFVRATN